MRNTTNFLNAFYAAIESLDLQTLEKISRFGGLSPSELATCIANPIDYSVDFPADPDIVEMKQTSFYSDLGKKAIDNNEVAIIIYTENDSTLSPTKTIAANMSLLNIKHLQTAGMQNVWYVSNGQMINEITNVLSASSHASNVKLFKQFESVRLLPDNLPDLNSFYSCGSGDIIPVLQEENTLQNFISNGGKYLFCMNMHNILSNIDLSLLGNHISNQLPITCEVTQRNPNENGLIACNLVGVNQIASNKRFTRETEDSFSAISTGTYIINANLNFEEFKWPWHRMKKVIGNKLVIQYERFLSDLTSFYKTQFILSSRNEKYELIASEEMLDTIDQTFEIK